MKITATNIASPRQITFKGRTETTGIYKQPVESGIFLGSEDVANDEVTDRKHHGGLYKACYLFSGDHYAYWEELYPELDWQYGMFGENITVSAMDDCKLTIGSIYAVGDAEIQITIPREPCYKLGVKFGSQEIINQFVSHGFPGTYARVLKEGRVKPGDTFKLLKEVKNGITTTQFFRLLYDKNKDIGHLKKALENEGVPPQKRNKLKKFLG
ncbi:MOSC domain-containing protein [Gaetbulibacter aestuarii]|uniref:MOSC domain-containing protein n=1 Tax=Gaetbulibacter aestuarii TaxID=1502358 RepID=A0ABW7MYM8_9FLAO